MTRPRAHEKAAYVPARDLALFVSTSCGPYAAAKERMCPFVQDMRRLKIAGHASDLNQTLIDRGCKLHI